MRPPPVPRPAPPRRLRPTPRPLPRSRRRPPDPVNRPPSSPSPSSPRPGPPQAIPEQPVARAPQVTDDQPIARKPTDEVAPKPRPVGSVEQRVAQPGDRICGACGEPNDPSRKFCRRCGANLVEAKVVAAAKVAWYRRLFGGGDKAPKQYAAGERTGEDPEDRPEDEPAREPRQGRATPSWRSSAC